MRVGGFRVAERPEPVTPWCPDVRRSELGAVDWGEFFKSSVRNPRPAQVVRRVATLRESRAFWVQATALDRKIKETPQIVASRRFAQLDDMGKRDYVARAVEKRTARLAVKMLGKRKFAAQAKGVRAFRILLDESMLDGDKPVLVRYKARNRRLPVKRSKKVLCREFVERFDRTFLPVAEVIVR